MPQIVNTVNPFSLGRSDVIGETIFNMTMRFQRLEETRRLLRHHVKQPSVAIVCPDYLAWQNLPTEPYTIKPPAAKR